MTYTSSIIRLAAVASAAAAFLMTASPSEAANGTIRIHVSRAGLVLGVQQGVGTLHFRRRNYPLRISGVGLGATIGVSDAYLVGTVRNIRRPSDIIGSYSASQAGASIVNGNRTAHLQNANGVVLDLSGQQTGLEFSVDLSGIEISRR
jgi:hypothetical protein